MNLKSWKSRVKIIIQRWRFLLQLYYILRPPKPVTHNHLLHRFASAKKEEAVFFVQVGAHAGGLHDPLDRYLRLNGWRGLFVEPQESELSNLKDAYRHFDGLSFENVAIDRVPGTRKFYSIAPDPKLPTWVSQLSSFHARVPELILEEYPRAQIAVDEVPCRSLEDLLEEYAYDTLDVLITDTEGHDYEVLKSLNLEKWKPKIILYEHYHLSLSDQQAAQQHLQAHDYHLWPNQANTLAVLSYSLVSRYTEVWLP